MGLFRVSNDAEAVKSPWDGTRRREFLPDAAGAAGCGRRLLCRGLPGRNGAATAGGDVGKGARDSGPEFHTA